MPGPVPALWMNARPVLGKGPSAPPAAPAAAEPRKKGTSSGEAASSHLVQAVLAITLAVVAWYVSVEQPMIRSLSGMYNELREVRGMQVWPFPPLHTGPT